MAIALLCTVISCGVRLLLVPSLGIELPYLTFTVGVMAAAWWGGWRSGVFATAASAIATLFFFVEPLYSLRLARALDFIGVFVFMLSGLLISMFVEALHRARREVVAQYQRLSAAAAHGEEHRAHALAQGERLRQTLMSIGDAVIVTDQRGRVETMNTAAEQLTGRVLADVHMLDVEQVLRLVDERQQQPMRSPVARALVEGRVLQLASPALLVHADGRRIPIEDSAAPIRNADGSVIGCVIVFRDVSERRTAAAVARAHESALTDLFENANVGLRWVGPDGIIRRANDEELRMLGYERDEYEGHHVREFHEDPQVAADVLATFDNRRGLRGIATRMRCKDGSLKDVMINCTVSTGADAAVNTWCFTLDVSDRVAAERTQALLASVVESSDDAIITKSLDGIVTSWNAGAARLFGYAADEAVGRNITLIIPPDRWKDEVRILAQVGRGELVPAFETQRVRQDGTLVPVSLSVSPVRDASGRVIGASKTARDISHRIAMESELREAARRKDEFLATLAHELRNPLAPMRHALHLLAALEPDSPRVAHVVGILTRQMDQMVRLIDDLMDISRIDRNKLALRRTTVELSTLVRQAVETVRPLVDTSRHTLSVEIPEQPIPLDVDHVRMVQVLTNLLSNAVKFTNPGGIIAIVAQQNSGQLHIRVSDNGIGIAPHRLASIFDIFAQGHERQEDSRGGLGIGLTLVRRIVELHGGRAYVESAGIGSGTTAVIELPLGVRASPVHPGGAVVVPAPHLTGRRILVVDDMRDHAETLAELLSVYGGAAVCAFDGAAAVRAFEQQPADVVLLDLGMPHISGFDVCRTIRALPGGPQAVLVALTGWGQEGDRDRTRAAGFDAHLVKPVDLPALLEQLRDLLATRSS